MIDTLDTVILQGETARGDDKTITLKRVIKADGTRLDIFKTASGTVVGIKGYRDYEYYVVSLSGTRFRRVLRRAFVKG